MPFIRAGGLAVHYQLEGSEGAPVVMLGNSLGTNLHLWDAQLPALLPKFRVLRYDMRGHGMTEAPQGVDAYSIDDLSSDALALLDALKLDRVHYCGLSIGGMVGQRLGAKAGGRFLSLILCNTLMRFAAPGIYLERAAAVRKNGLESIAAAVMERWFTERFRAEKPEVIAGYVAMLTRNAVAGYAGCCHALAAMNLEADARRIACPTLVVVGGRDLATPPEAGQALAQAVKGAKLVALENAPHISAVEQPAALNAALAGFLA